MCGGALVREIWMAAALGMSLAAAPAGQQQTTPQQQQQQQQIPDAPKPQLPGVANVAPGKGTTPTDNGSGSSSTTDETEQTDIPSSLPASEKAVPDADVAPVVPEAGKYGDTIQTLKLRVNYVEIPFTVKDSKGHLVPGIQPREIHVYENNVRQHVQVFTVDPFPLTVAVVIDQSLPFTVMTQVNNALGNLPNAFAAYDDVAVFTYNNGPKMQTDFTGGTSPRLAAVIERSKTTGRDPMYYAPGEALGGGIRINSGAQDNMTPLDGNHNVGSPQGIAQVEREPHTLNDAILMAAKAVTKEARGPAGLGRRRIVYVISDGKEYGSKAKQKEVIRYLQENKVQVYATVVGDSSLTGLGFISHLHLPLMMRDNILQAYTKTTGGETYADYRSKAIEASFSKITEEERTQYTVGYNTHEPFIDEKYRKVDVRVLRPNLEIIAKDGYYPSAEDVAPPTPAQPAVKQPAQP
jgi:VWFA-related protein